MKLTTSQLRALIREAVESDSLVLVPMLKELRVLLDRMDEVGVSSGDVQVALDKLHSAYIDLMQIVLSAQKKSSTSARGPGEGKGHFLGSRWVPEE